jgi:hypothetical protein
MPGASSPEELETLLEDAVLLHDDRAVADLFERNGVVVRVPSWVTGRGRAGSVLIREGFVASVRSVTVVHDVAVVVGQRTVNFSGRRPDRTWRLLATVVMPTSPGP